MMGGCGKLYINVSEMRIVIGDFYGRIEIAVRYGLSSFSATVVRLGALFICCWPFG